MPNAIGIGTDIGFGCGLKKGERYEHHYCQSAKQLLDIFLVQGDGRHLGALNVHQKHARLIP
ncbi:hypothetical protein GCM10009621_12560 [Corynebacterium felinum]